MHIRRFHPLARDYPFLQAQLNQFLDTAAFGIDGRGTGLMLRFWATEADRFLMAMRLADILQRLPKPPRVLHETVTRKEILYAIGHNHRPLVYTAWNRNEAQRLRDIFRTADPVDTHHLCLVVREQCLRYSRKRRLVTQLCLHGLIVTSPPGGFYSVA